MVDRVDVTSWNVLCYSLSLFLSIYLSSLCLVWCLSLPGSPPNPTAAPPPFCFPPHSSLFFHICISLYSPSFNVSFFLLFCVCSFFSLIPVWNMCWDQPAGHLAVMTVGLLQCRDDPWTPRLWPLSFSLLSAPALSLHTASLLFISEHQFQQGSSTCRTWEGWSELGKCVKQKKNHLMQLDKRSTA